MGKILLLPKHVVDMIAAGEVIERPASVVRELVENALDAGARRIDIRIEEGGKSLIAVTDDGAGIPAEDLPLSVKSHATSKLARCDDLFCIRTLGFRGEALPSIAAVSMLRIASQAKGADIGAALEVREGESSEVSRTGMAEGTTVEVRKLFFNTPVRRRFLRKDATEVGHITELVTQYALAHPSVHFHLAHDQREIFDAPAVNDVRKRIETLFSGELAGALIPIFHREAGLSLKGLIAPPTHVKPNTRSIYTFLNGRAIRDRTLLHAVIDSYRDAIPRDRYPIVFLFLAMDPKDVDVNVHPAKIEVRFRHTGRLHSLVQSLFRDALGTTSAPPPQLTLRGEPRPHFKEQRSFPLTGEGSSLSPRERVREALDAYMEHHRPAPPVPTSPLEADSPAPEGPAAPTLPKDGRPFLQVHGSYIVREAEDSIEIIDQHALCERVLYNEIRPRVEREGLTTQRLLIPLTLDLDRSRGALLEGNLDLFAKFGLEINRFGTSTFAVQSIPSFLPDGEVFGFIEDVLADLSENAPSASGRRIDEVAKRLACRGAVKAGQSLNEVELRALLESASDLPPAPTCPHGRPAIVRITLAELERSFGRR